MISRTAIRNLEVNGGKKGSVVLWGKERKRKEKDRLQQLN